MSALLSNPLSSDGHLTDDAILLLTTGELNPQATAQAEEHLQDCSDCQHKLEDASGLRLQIREALRRRNESVFRRRLEATRKPRSIVGIASALASAAAIIVAIIVWASLPGKVEAKEILDRAVMAETRRSTSARFLRVRAGATSCTVGLIQAAQASEPCVHLQGTLQNIPWDWQNPLSAGAFRRWRNGLSKKQDTVRKTESSVVVTTVSGEGPIHSAEITLASTDYRATQLRLSSDPPVEISEETVKAPPEELAATGVSRPATNDGLVSPAPKLPVDNPADVAEVNSWVALGRLNLLDGWKATVQREGQHVAVVATVDSNKRDELLQALSVLRADTTEVSLLGSPDSPMERFAPHRESFGATPPLGKAWMRQVLPAGTDFTSLNNRVLTASQHILGFATIRDTLLARQAALQGCTCAGRLEPVIENARQELSASTDQLVVTLQPLFEASPDSPPLLSIDDAHRLDAALMHIFASGPSEPGTLEEALAEIETLLPLHHR